MVYLILCWNINTVFSQRRVYSEYIANAGPLPLLEGLALSQLPGILSKSLQVIPLGGEYLGRGRGKWGGRESKEKGEKEKGGDRRGGKEEKGEREREGKKVRRGGRKRSYKVRTRRGGTGIYTHMHTHVFLTSERCLVSWSTLSHTLLVCSTPTAFSWPSTAISWGRTVATISPVPTLTRE